MHALISTRPQVRPIASCVRWVRGCSRLSMFFVASVLAIPGDCLCLLVTAYLWLEWTGYPFSTTKRRKHLRKLNKPSPAMDKTSKRRGTWSLPGPSCRTPVTSSLSHQRVLQCVVSKRPPDVRLIRCILQYHSCNQYSCRGGFALVSLLTHNPL
jgi:hypothetical protein